MFRISKSKVDKKCHYLYKSISKEVNPYRQIVALWLPWTGVWSRTPGIWRVAANVYEVSFWDNKNTLKLVVTAAQVYDTLKNTEMYIINRSILGYVNYISV